MKTCAIGCGTMWLIYSPDGRPQIISPVDEVRNSTGVWWIYNHKALPGDWLAQTCQRGHILVHEEVYAAMKLWWHNNGFAGMKLAEFLSRTYAC